MGFLINPYWGSATPPPPTGFNPAINIIPGTGPGGESLPVTPFFTDSLTFGYQFSILAQKTINAIGVYDHNSDGISQFHKVGLWKVDEFGGLNLISQIAFDPTSTYVSENSWCWQPIPEQTLEIGVYSIAATWSGTTDPLAFKTPPPGAGISYSVANQVNYLFPLRSDPVAIEDAFGVSCPWPPPLNVDFEFNPDDLSSLCPIPLERVDVDAGGYFSACVSFVTP